MRNCSEVWCATSDLSLEEINRRACQEWEAGKVPTLVFISNDLYKELMLSMGAVQRVNYGGSWSAPAGIISITTSVGSLNVQSVSRLKNFLLIGCKEDFEAFVAAGVDPMFWSDEERARIDKAFEDLIILEGTDNG